MNFSQLITDVKRHNLEPGSAEWLAHRAQQFNAGDVAAAAGVDPNKSRTDLLDELVLGFGQDVSYFQQRIFDNGHRVEALARPLAERIIGEDLYPFVYSAACQGLERRVGASVDGAPFGRTARLHWECKSLNDELRSALPYKGQADIASNDAKRLPKKYRLQMCQQALVRGSEAVLFTAAQFDDEGNVVDERHAWYEPEPELCAQVVRTWEQVQEDLPHHKPVVHAERPKGEKLEAIGLPVVRVMGSVVESNLPQWKALAFARIEALNTELRTDEDFGQAIEDVKWCEESEKTLKKLKRDVIGQMATVEEVTSTLDTIVDRLAAARKALDAKVAQRKLEIRNEVIAAHEKKAQEHREKMIARLEAVGATLNHPCLPRNLMPVLTHATVAADFNGAIKGLKTIKSLHDKANAELARVKIALSAVTDTIEVNLRHYRDTCGDWLHLFPGREMPELVNKPAEDFQALCAARIDAAQRAEQERKDREAAAEARRQEEARRAAATVQASAAIAQAAAPQPADPDPFTGHPPAIGTVVDAEVPRVVGSPGAGKTMIRRGPPTLKLGTICERLGFTVTAAFLSELGFTALKGERNALLFHEEDFRPICKAITNHVAMVAAQHFPQPAVSA